MQFQINSKSFLSALLAVGKVVPAKSAIQILSAFLVEVNDGEVSITAADTENRATFKVQAITDGTGKFCVEAKFLTDIVRTLPDCPVTVNVSDNGEITVTTEKNTFKAVSLDASVYPDDDFKETESIDFTIATETLLTGFAETSASVGTDDFRPQMMGVLLDVKGETATFVATDTRQLVKSSFAIDTEAAAKCIISTKAITAITALAAKSPSVTVKVFPTAIVFSSDSFTLRCQLIKGNFPDYSRVIPINNSVRTSFNRAELLSAVRRVAACADTSHGMLRFDFELGSVVVSSKDDSFGRKAKETIDSDYNCTPLTIGLSSDLLARLLSVTAAEKVTFDMADPSRPVVITADGDEHLTMLLMPMVVNQ